MWLFVSRGHQARLLKLDAHYLAILSRQNIIGCLRHQVGRLVSFPGSTCHSPWNTQIQLSWDGVDSARD